MKNPQVIRLLFAGWCNLSRSLRLVFVILTLWLMKGLAFGQVFPNSIYITDGTNDMTFSTAWTYEGSEGLTTIEVASETLIDPGSSSPDKPYYEIGLTGSLYDGSSYTWQETTPIVTTYAIGEAWSPMIHGWTLHAGESSASPGDWPEETSTPAVTYQDESLLIPGVKWMHGHRLILSSSTVYGDQSTYSLDDCSIVEHFTSNTGISVTVTRPPLWGGGALAVGDILFFEGTLDGQSFKGRWDNTNSEWEAFYSSNSESSTNFVLAGSGDTNERETNFFGFDALYVNGEEWAFVGGTDDDDGYFRDVFSDGTHTLTMRGPDATQAEFRFGAWEDPPPPVYGSYSTSTGFSMLGTSVITGEVSEANRTAPYFVDSNTVAYKTVDLQGVITQSIFRFSFGTDAESGTVHTDYYVTDFGNIAIVGNSEGDGDVYFNNGSEVLGEPVTTVSDGEFASADFSALVPPAALGPPSVRLNGQIYRQYVRFESSYDNDEDEDLDVDYSDLYSSPLFDSLVTLTHHWDDDSPNEATEVSVSLNGETYTGTFSRGRFAVEDVTLTACNTEGTNLAPSYGPPAITVNTALWDFRGTWNGADFYAAPGQSQGLWIDSGGVVSGTNPFTEGSFDGGTFEHGAFEGETDNIEGVNADGSALRPRYAPGTLYVNGSQPWTFQRSSAVADFYAGPNSGQWLTIGTDGSVTLVDGEATSTGTNRNGRFSGVPIAIAPGDPTTTSFAAGLDVFGDTISLGAWADDITVAGVTWNYADDPNTLFGTASFTLSRPQALWRWSRGDPESSEATLPMMQLNNEGLTVQGNIQATGIMRIWPAGDLPMDFTEGPTPPSPEE